jgi:dCTP diphosphatase
MTQIEALMKHLYEYLAERGWENLPPASIAKSISIEAAELLEHFQWSEPSAETILNDSLKLDKIQSELADVLIYCLEMALVLKLNPDTIVRNKIAKIKTKYPADKVLGNSKAYLQLKQEAREKGTN